jgi:hypothetical protein
VPEVVLKPAYDFLGFFAGPFLVHLHRQKDKICVFGPFVGGKEIECLSNEFDILFVAWNDKRVQNLFSIIGKRFVLFMFGSL